MKHKSRAIILIILFLTACTTNNQSTTNKNEVENSEASQITSNFNVNKSDLNDLINNREPLFKVQGNGVEILGENLTLVFRDEFEVETSSIHFGPKGLIPESPTDRKLEEYYYSMKLIPKRSFEDISSQFGTEEMGWRIVVSPKKETIKDFDVVKWALGGFCEERFMELMGKENNLQFYSSGCHTHNNKEDFEYFESLVQ